MVDTVSYAIASKIFQKLDKKERSDNETPLSPNPVQTKNTATMANKEVQPESHLMKSLIELQKAVTPHQFEFAGTTYEWLNGMYYMHVNTLKSGSAFGQDALLTDDPRNATIKC